ncbi:Tissue factor pathway inhibitor [Operophtera brumata]|uniref:Tissue factor pathway inhibitor n=1 Tax=Operophtera brumata TaxID=104452 RepID=A0A0L7L7X8_OPEBR|nr:Tissue factor pathway inhibitor [Operophtera brumata]
MSAEVLRSNALVVLLLLFGGHCIPHNRKRKPHRYTYPGNRSTANPYTKTICMQLDNTIRGIFLGSRTSSKINGTRTCKRRLYSGCGGNQNNFESQNECMKTCLTPPDNTLNRSSLMTTCVPFLIPGLQ